MAVKDFRIIHRGCYTPGEVSILASPDVKRFSASTQRLIKAAWESAKLDPDLNLFNSRVLSYAGYSKRREGLAVKVQITDYKSFYGTNVCNHATLPKDQLANALAVCGVVISKDGAILMGKRSTQVAEDRQHWHVIGGTMELSRNLFGYRVDRQRFERQCLLELDPTLHIMRELNEELGIDPFDVCDIVCMGLGENLLIGKPELLMLVNVTLTARQLRECAPHAIWQGEHSSLITLPLEDIAMFVHDYPVAPIGKAALFACLGLHLEQENWPRVPLDELSARIGF